MGQLVSLRSKRADGPGADGTLDAALGDGRLFRGGGALAQGREGLPSGIDALDQALPWGGFPRGALTEVLVTADGVGELSLLMPALARLSLRERIVLVAPPYVPYAPGLLHAGVALPRLVWIDAPPERAMWAAEQCLRAGCLGAVLAWTRGGDERVLRRLQVAAEDGGSHAFVMRPARHAANPSPAALRLVVEPEPPDSLRLRVLKCRGAQPPAVPLRYPRSA